jgi:hypothetical protein
MAYDQKHKLTLLYGGWPTRGIPYFDTWTWNGTHWAHQHPATNPRLWSPSIAYDQVRQEVVLFGTTVPSGGPVDGVAGQTWVWDGVNWRQEHPQTSPNARHYPQLVYDSTLMEVIMFGGGGFKSEVFADTWAWNGTDWHRLSGSIPGLSNGGVFGAAAYDPVIDRVVLYEGLSAAGAINPGMWWFDGSTWTQQSTAGAGLPTDSFGMVYDSAIQRLVLYGGSDTRNLATGIELALKSDIWVWDTHSWQRLPMPSGPLPRRNTAIDYDSDAQVILIFGGGEIVGENEFALGDTWTWNEARWTVHGGAPKIGSAVFNLSIEGSPARGDRFVLEFLPSGTLAETTFCESSPPCQGGHTYTLRFQVVTSGQQTYAYWRVRADGHGQQIQAGSVDLSQPVNITARYRY